jgi:hypothetical protein
MEHAPQLVEFYNTHVARNPKIDMVICSQDKSAEAQRELLSAYPLPALSLEAVRDRRSIPSIYRHIDRRIGWLIAVDREGKEVVTGDSDEGRILAFIQNGCVPIEP